MTIETILAALLASYFAFNLGVFAFALQKKPQTDWPVLNAQVPPSFIRWCTLIGLLFAGTFVGIAMLRKPKEPVNRNTLAENVEYTERDLRETYQPEPVAARPGGP